jgi:RND family efflux transporter MFP subunit
MLDKPRPQVTPGEPSVLRDRALKKWRWIGIAGLCVLGLMVVLGLTARFVASQQTRNWTSEQAIPTVHLITVKSAHGGDFTLPGDIQAFYTATIYAQITGYVQNWFTDIGTPVKAGQLMAQIDPRPYQAALDQAQGQLAKDQASLAGAELDLTRYQALQGQNAIAKQTVDDEAATVATDKGIVEADKANLDTARINLAYTRIVAPFDGVVTSRSVDVGQLVLLATASSASAMPLFTVTDQNRLRIYVRVPQGYSGLITPGMTINFTVPEHPGQLFTAKLVASADAIVSQSGTQLVQFQIDNSKHALKPGDYATVNFGIPSGATGVRVPVTALTFRDQGMLVAMVGKDGKVVMKPVHISTDFGTAVEVDTGLKTGDQVIDNPPDSLRPGDRVRIGQSGDDS